MTAIKENFEKEFGAGAVTNGNKENVPTSRVSGTVADNEKGTLSGNSLYSLMETTGVDNERSAFHKNFKIRDFISEKWKKDRPSYISLLKRTEEEPNKGYSDKEIVTAVLQAITFLAYKICLKPQRPNPFKIHEIPSLVIRRKKYNIFVTAPFINNPRLTGNCYTVRIPRNESEAKIICVVKISYHRNKV